MVPARHCREMQREVVKINLKLRLKTFNLVRKMRWRELLLPFLLFCCCCGYSSCMLSVISGISSIRTDTNTITATSNGRQRREALSAVPTTDIDSWLWAPEQLIGSLAHPSVSGGRAMRKEQKWRPTHFQLLDIFFSCLALAGID